MDVMFSDMMILFSCIYTKFQFASFSLFKEKKRKNQAVSYTQRNSEIPFFHILYAWYKSGAGLVHCMLRLLPRNIAAFPSFVFLFRAASPHPLTLPTLPPTLFSSVSCAMNNELDLYAWLNLLSSPLYGHCAWLLGQFISRLYQAIATPRQWLVHEQSVPLRILWSLFISSWCDLHWWLGGSVRNWQLW